MSSAAAYEWLLTSGYVGAVSSVAAIVLILCSKAYKDFSHRLYLYITIGALALSMCWCVEQIIVSLLSQNSSKAQTAIIILVAIGQGLVTLLLWSPVG